MHFPLFKWLEPAARKFYGIEVLVQIHISFLILPAILDISLRQRIKRFMSFRLLFVLGDLHAHVLNILFVLTILGILLAWLMMRNKKRDREATAMERTGSTSHFTGRIFIGLFHTTNFWDFQYILLFRCSYSIFQSNCI